MKTTLLLALAGAAFCAGILLLWFLLILLHGWIQDFTYGHEEDE